MNFSFFHTVIAYSQIFFDYNGNESCKGGAKQNFGKNWDFWVNSKALRKETKRGLFILKSALGPLIRFTVATFKTNQSPISFPLFNSLKFEHKWKKKCRIKKLKSGGLRSEFLTTPASFFTFLFLATFSTSSGTTKKATTRFRFSRSFHRYIIIIIVIITWKRKSFYWIIYLLPTEL